jgi:hypothetical protein
MIHAEREKFLSIAVQCLLCLLAATVLSGCHMDLFEAHKPSDWFLKSVKTDAHGDVITLYHAGKVYVARCAGVKFATSDKFFPDTHCPYLTQHVGAAFENGIGTGQVSRPVSDIRYYLDADEKSYEDWEVVEETAR